jgi:hypothetical protein
MQDATGTAAAPPPDTTSAYMPRYAPPATDPSGTSSSFSSNGAGPTSNNGNLTSYGFAPTDISPSLNPDLRPLHTYSSLGMPSPLYGSHEILLHQNTMADEEGLERIRNDAELNRMRREGTLLPLPVGAHLVVDPRLPVNRRYCRPWTAKFLSDISANFYAEFHAPLQVNSAVRTVAFQQHLERVNGNAAPAVGETASPHLTGAAIDIGKRNLSAEQIAWMRTNLLALEDAGKIDVEEEFQQSVFHISVYKIYAPPPVLKAMPHTRSSRPATKADASAGEPQTSARLESSSLN